MSKILSKNAVKKAAVGILTSLMLMAGSVIPVYAQGFISPQDSPTAISTATQGQGNFKQLARTIVEFILGFLGFIAVIMIIYGGFLYVTGAGNQEKIDSAKKIIMYSIVGIIFILLSFAIVNTVLTAGTGGAGQ